MHKTIKNLFFGALVASVIGGAFTMTARRAHAAELCGPCDDGASGYMVASGEGLNDLVCVDESDTRYQQQCGGNS